MEERQITVDGHSYILESPFMVVATQNPIEQEGTYHLPEAQLDRFLFKILVTYPTQEEELTMLSNHHTSGLNEMIAEVKPVLSAEHLLDLRENVHNIHVEQKLLQYITSIVTGTRNHKSIYLGASPRASIGILNGAKALAAMDGRSFVIPEDIVEVAVPVLRHRISLTPDKEIEGVLADDVIRQLLQTIEVPR
jgi:MoxR-like ATPase